MLDGVIFISALFALYALTSKWLTRSSLTGPLLFTAAGTAIGLITLSEGTPTIAFVNHLDNESIQVLLESTLLIVLFSDAVMIDFRAVRREAFLPTRLLGIGLPLTVLVGTITATLLFPDLSFWQGAVIAIVLAPTDAALGQAVVSNERVPSMVRQGLGVESGLNDGIAVPFLTIAVAAAAHEMQGAREIATVFVEEIGFAILVGVAVGLLGGFLVRYASKRDFTGREGRGVLVVFLALLAGAGAAAIGGSGFIAAFVGGLTFGAQVRSTWPHIHHFADGVGHLLTMASFFVFGALLLAPRLEFVTYRTFAYAVLSLTVIRMVPVWVSLMGTGLRLPTTAFIAWFGPRGLASLVFISTIVFEADFEGADEILTVGGLTVALSVVLHGVTAWPMSLRYSSWFERQDEDELTEAADVTEMQFRSATALEKTPHRRDQ